MLLISKEKFKRHLPLSFHHEILNYLINNFQIKLYFALFTYMLVLI